MPKTSSTIISNQLAQAQKIRRKQIDKLKQQKLNVTIINSDTQYRVDFVIKRNDAITSYGIVINLPPSFPSEAPVLFVNPPCSHKYIDVAQQVVNFPPLENFKSKPDLASVVKRLVMEFEKNPPIPLVINEFEKQQQENMLRMFAQHYPNLNEVTASTSKPEIAQKVEPAPSVPKPLDILPELEDLTIEELRELDTDEMQLLALFHGMDISRKMFKDQEEVSKQIEDVANENLSKSELLEGRRKTLVQSYDKCKKLKDQYDKNVKKFIEASEWMALHNLSLTLQVATAEQEEKAEKLVESFLDGETDVADFTKEFVKAKKLSATRKAKEDKIGHILTSR